MQWLDLLDLGIGSRCADFGCGPGYLSVLASRRVGSTGHVYAIDRSPEMVAYARRVIAEQQSSNVTVMQADIVHRIPIEERLDAVVIANVLHHVDDIAAVLREARRILLPDGRLLVVEFDPEGPATFGPPRSMRLASEMVRRLLEETKFGITAEGRTEPDWYYVLATPKAEE